MTTVSIVIPTHDRADLLRDRSIPSVFAQSHMDWELHVVGDGTDSATVALMAGLSDPRVRFTNLPRQDYPSDGWARWALSGVDAINHGLDTANGEWVLVLGDDDELLPDALVMLLAMTVRHPEADVVYGMSRAVRDGVPGGQTWGAWPPGRGNVTEGGSLRRTSLPWRYDKGCIGRCLEADADLWTRMYAAGVPFAFEPVVVHNYWQR